jgi:hypothetical protein
MESFYGRSEIESSSSIVLLQLNVELKDRPG